MDFFSFFRGVSSEVVWPFVKWYNDSRSDTSFAVKCWDGIEGKEEAS